LPLPATPVPQTRLGQLDHEAQVSAGKHEGPAPRFRAEPIPTAFAIRTDLDQTCLPHHLEVLGDSRPWPSLAPFPPTWAAHSWPLSRHVEIRPLMSPTRPAEVVGYPRPEK